MKVQLSDTQRKEQCSRKGQNFPHGEGEPDAGNTEKIWQGEHGQVRADHVLEDGENGGILLLMQCQEGIDCQHIVPEKEETHRCNRQPM